MNFSKAISDLALLVTKTSSDAETREKLKYALNFAKVEVGKSYLWRDLVRTAELYLRKKLDGGTVSVTQGSRTVTGAGTAFTDTMAGWFFEMSGGRTYRVLSSSSAFQTLTLESPVMESSANEVRYDAWQRYYRLPSDVRLVLPDEDSQDLKVPFSIQGQDLNVSDYTGTVSLVKDSNVLTGVGTLFLDNIKNGDLIQVQSKEYHILTIKSDIELIMTNYANENISTTAIFRAEFPYLADIQTRQTEDSVLSYKYIRHLYSMVNDNDTTELCNKFDKTLLDIAQAEYNRISRAPSWTQDIQLAQLRLDTLKTNSELVFRPYIKFQPIIPRGMGRE